MSNNSVITSVVSSDRIRSDLDYLIHHSTIYDNYTVCNTLDMSQYKYSFETVTDVSAKIFDVAKNKYKQLKLIINDETITIYPHIGTA